MEPPITRMLQNFLLVWLDERIHQANNDDYHNTITILQRVVNTVNTFNNADECIDFITNIKEEQIFMIISGKFSQTIVPLVQDIFQVNCVYIFCGNKSLYEQWTQQWSKVKGVFTDINPICEALKQVTQHCDHNLISISFIKSIDGAPKQNLDQLDQSFMYTQILKEILLSIDFAHEHINEFLTYCRQQFVGNATRLQNVDKLEEEYRHHEPIWWYTSDTFLYYMLNRALRLMEVDLIIKMGFFVRDLHNHISALHSKQFTGHNQLKSFVVFRGQNISKIDFEQLMETKGGLLSFNNFLSTTLDLQVSLAFAGSNELNPDMRGVLFKISVDPTVSSTPFANVCGVGYFQMEEEILFSMHSVFRIEQIKQFDNDNHLWQVELTLTSDNDPQLHLLTEWTRQETSGSTGWERLSGLLLKLGHFNKAEVLCEILRKQTDNADKITAIYNNLGRALEQQGKYTESITIYEKALDMDKRIRSSNHRDLPASHNNIGLVYDSMGEYSKALSSYEKALEIEQKTLSSNHPDLATSYNNIGLVYNKMSEYSKALSYFEKALEIRQNTLPPNHPDLATSYNNIGLVYEKMGEYSKALSDYEKAFKIRQKTLPPNHPSLATSYNNIGSVYSQMGEYSNALSYYEKALEIEQKTLSPNHSLLAISYNNMGLLYSEMGEYSEALSYFKKAFKIRQKTLSSNHPSLATSYNNIGLVYDKMGEHSKALSYHEKAFEIRQKTLPPNHPDLATSYNNIGSAYGKMGEYLKALTFYERALNIFQRSFSENHPNIKTVQKNIEILKRKI